MKYSTQRLRQHLYVSEYQDPLDEYENMLNLFKPLDEITPDSELSKPLVESVYELSSITNEGETKLATTKKTKSPLADWDQWDEFMETELGDLDADLPDDKKWVQELRDIIESKRGQTIWTRKNEHDINREIKKTQSPKPLNIPEGIASIITAVYIERSKKLSEIKNEDKLAYMTFRKFMVDLKKKTKKDPVLQTKLELTKVRMLFAASCVVLPSLVEMAQAASSFEALSDE